MKPDLPISASSVQLLIKIASDRGIDADDCLRDTGIPTRVLQDPLAEVTIRQEFAVMRNLLARVGSEPGFGIDCGRRYHLAMHGTWGLLMATARDLREVVTIALQYIELGWAFTAVSFRAEAGTVALVIEDHAIPVDLRPYLVERISAAIRVLLVELVGAEVALTAVRFRHAEPSDISRHRDVLGLTPTFGATENAVSFDLALLDLPLPQSNEWVRRGYEQMCSQMLAARRARTGIAGEVRDLLVREPGRIPDTDEVASELGISARTLLRRLQDEGTSYRRLVDEVRQAIAEELLDRTQLTTEQISYRLGYTESANFVRAFKRWSGRTPQAHRQGRAGLSQAAPLQH